MGLTVDGGAVLRTLVARHVTTAKAGVAMVELGSVTMQFDEADGIVAVDHVVVALAGEHDRSTSAHLLEVLDDAILDDVDVVVDLSDVTFLGVAPVRALAVARQRLAQRGRSFTLRAPSPCARRAIELCHYAGMARTTAGDDDLTPGGGDEGALASWVSVPRRDRAGAGSSASGSPTTDLGQFVAAIDGTIDLVEPTRSSGS